MNTSKQNQVKTVFTFQAPNATTVELAGDFTGWELSPLGLKKLKNGLWKTTVSLAAGCYQYRFLVDGQWQDDPACTTRVPSPFGVENCVRQLS